ncbi:Protein of unknown function [Gryllus bimaculatus]|nr:Protein of unknown function [Gryllus bimaculatus]
MGVIDPCTHRQLFKLKMVSLLYV